MSTFSALNTAASGLAAARRGMDVVGQNITNQNTVGYTRQRLDTSAVGAVSGRFSTGVRVGQGVSVDGVSRLGDALLDARVRDALAASGFFSARAVAATAAEASMAEPTDDGLAARFSAFWAGWQDLANTPDSGAAGAVVLENGRELAARLAGGYRAVADQWSQLRAGVDQAVDQVGATADRIATLNRAIRDAEASGRPAHELVDERSVLAQQLAHSIGAQSTVEKDGTMTVRLGGNALVAGTDARELTVSGPASLADPGRITLAWADAPDVPITIEGGEVAGTLAVLAPADAGGMLAGLADTYNEVATALADAVNTQHRAGVTASGTPGGDFFALSESGPAALGLTVVPTGVGDLAVAGDGAGALDASNADAISQLGHGPDSPDALWADHVIGFGVATAGEVQRAQVSEAAANTAVSAQQSVAAVDGDEETIDLVTYQAAYQAAARVVTAIDEMLDVLINRVGLVGR